MSVNDPISDMLTRIRNAGMARQAETTMPATKILVAIAKILKEEGYISDYRLIERRPQDQLVIALRYGVDRKPASGRAASVRKARATLRMAQFYPGSGPASLPACLCSLGFSA